MSAFQRVLDALAATTGKAPTGHGRQRMARCPVHDDRKESLSVGVGRDQPVVLKCQANRGCTTDEILAKLGLTWADLSEPRPAKQDWTPCGHGIAAEYRYVDERGEHLFSVVRCPRKDFAQWRPDPAMKSGRRWKLGEIRRVLYRLPQVIEAVQDGRQVWLTEGEKDADRLVSMGLTATCNPHGAGKWRPEFTETLAGAVVMLVADRDAPGRAHARQVATALRDAGCDVTVVEAADGKDVSDHLDAGRDLADLIDTETRPLQLVREPDAERPPPVEEPHRHVVIASATSMRMRVPKWLYDRRIPSDAITLVAGREGIGKSTIAYDLTARVTRGELPGRYQGTPRGVGVIASEDSWESVILPRLVAARADLSRVYRLEARTEEQQIETVSAPTDLESLAQVCAEHDIGLLVIDPIMSVISGTLDTHKDREVRQALDPLARFCATHGIAVLGLIHVNKSSTSDPLNSVMASRAFTAVARSVLYCVVDPEAENEDRYLFGHPKSNLGPKQPTLAYRIVECKIEIDDPDEPDPVVVTSRVAWEGIDSRSIRDVLEPRRERASGELATRIAAWFEDRGSAANPAEVEQAFPHEKPATVRQNLRRMTDRGTLLKLAHGLYRLRDSPDSDTSCDTSLETSEVSQPSQVSQRQDQVTVVTDVTVSQARNRASQRPSQPPSGDLWAGGMPDEPPEDDVA